jgi:hypothetical protein
MQTDERDEQLQNAQFPIRESFSTEEGMQIDERDEQL